MRGSTKSSHLFVSGVMVFILCLFLLYWRHEPSDSSSGLKLFKPNKPLETPKQSILLQKSAEVPHQSTNA